ncbi:phosphopantetheine-binding protein [Pseudoalteromonas sp. DL2-H2.2]|uniref:phosphopantetheine-binding protein n=1 Tax=Pseudoalteromonas sp. DL2-H2.2 TaxID=2908889 RepID=UPI001F17186F|nr:phosphopantetheine-binding protein [Pseudoalteromonas sp. DL2-H2.2]MCF2909712.1 phosphopantetheine-binding protein [Pseudoalteromonas sp. DL2-H2.2]
MSLEKSIEQTIFDKLSSKHDETVLLGLDRNVSLITSGLLDSLEFISMLMEIESNLNIDIDFEDADPVQFTTVNGLVKLLCVNENV